MAARGCNGADRTGHDPRPRSGHGTTDARCAPTWKSPHHRRPRPPEAAAIAAAHPSPCPPTLTLRRCRRRLRRPGWARPAVCLVPILPGRVSTGRVLLLRRRIPDTVGGLTHLGRSAPTGTPVGRTPPAGPDPE